MNYIPPIDPEDRARQRRLSRNPAYIGALIAFAIVGFVIVMAVIT